MSIIRRMSLHIARFWGLVLSICVCAAAQNQPALDPEFVSERYHALIAEGDAAWAEGELENAAKAFSQAISMAANAGAQADGLDVESAIASLASVREAQDQWDEAVTLHNAAVDYAQTHYGPDALEALYALHARGQHYHSRGYLKEALEDHQKALDLIRKSDDPDAADMAMVYDSLGWDTWAQGRFDDAIKLFEQAREKSGFADDEFSEMNALIAIADSYYHWRKLDEALKASEQSLRVLRKAEVDLEQSARVYFCHGWLLDKLGRTDDGGTYFGRSLTAASAAYGEDDPDYAHYLALAAAHDVRAGQIDRGRERLAQATAIYEKSYSRDSSQMGDMLHDYADALLETGRLDESRPLHERLVAGRKKVLGEQSCWVAWPQLQLARTSLQEGKAEEALALAEAALEIWRRHEVTDHDVIDAHRTAAAAIARLAESTPELAERSRQHTAAADALLATHFPHISPAPTLTTQPEAR